MKEYPRQVWAWLADENNRGRVRLIIVTVAGLIIPFLVLSITNRTGPTSPPSGGEVRLSVEDFQAVMEKREQEIRKELARAHGEERGRLENELTEVERQLSNIEAAHADALRKISELETTLARFSADISDNRLAKIRAAIETGDFSEADALLKELEDRAAVAVVRAAEVAFQRGQIAAIQIKWSEAATHFDKAARLNPTYTHLNEAGNFAERTARYKAARHHFENLLELSRREHGGRSPETATALNNLASVLGDTGQYDKAEPLLRQAVEIRHITLGEEHPDYATALSNLASVLRATSQYAEAEPPLRQAVEIRRITLGEEHPDYATALSNLAVVLRATSRDVEVEPLYRQALEIHGKALGAEHPSYATSLNNLASMLRATNRYVEAEPLFRQALEIRRKALGAEHPSYATSLNNLAGLLVATSRYAEAKPLYQQAMEIVRASLGDDHPNTRQVARNYVWLLRAQFPDNPALAELNAVFGGEHQ